jgi:hypothetical protein
MDGPMGGDDGGIDGFFLILNEMIISEVPEDHIRRAPLIDVYLISAKRTAKFKQAPINALIASLPELLDLTKNRLELRYPFAEDVLNLRELFRELYVTLADKHPKVRITIIYASRGDTNEIASNIASRAILLRDEIANLFSKAEVSVNFYGANELLEIARKKKSYSLRLNFIESNISRTSTNYVVLCLLKDYFKFVTDDEGRLRRYLFESNVRDYLGELAINRDISETLALREHSNQMDFWWLNNGITLLATSATIVGKQLSLDNVQIVNGLQSTEIIYKYFKNKPNFDDDRAILVKIIITSDDNIRDRIIKATNYQNMVDLASLRGTDKIQRDIEHFLGDNSWFYDRRKGFYKNQGRPADRIVSISYLGAAVQALALRQFSTAFRQKTKWLRNDKSYSQVYNPKWSLDLYLVCLEITKSIESDLTKSGWRKGNKDFKRAISLAIGSVWVSRKLGKSKFNPNELSNLKGLLPTAEEVNAIREEIGTMRFGGKRQIEQIASRINGLCLIREAPS